MLSLKSNKFFIRTFKLLFIGIVLLSIIFGFIGINLQKKYTLELLHSEAKSLAQSIVFVSSDALVTNDNSYLVEFNHKYLRKNEKMKNIIISKTDNTYLNIQKKRWSFDDTIDDSFKKMEQKKEQYKILYSKVLNEEVFHYSYPIHFSKIPWGWLHLSFDLKEFNENNQKIYLQYFYFFITLLILSFIVSFYIAKIFSEPIIKLNAVVSSITYDNLDVEIKASSNDEVGELSLAFNKMIYKLNKSQNELKISHQSLEQRVQERTKELEYANINLEDKSLALSELNKNLDYKVKQEIEKSRSQESMLLQQSRLAAMGEMVGNIAHQWRQPLNALGIIIQNIALSYSLGKLDNNFLEKSVDDSLKLTNMMSSTIEDFRNFFKPNKTKGVFLLSESLYSSLELIDATLTNNNIKVISEIENDLYTNGFQNEFAQAILNILSNAKDALIEGKIDEPKIIIKLYKSNNIAKLCIYDNAYSIKNEILKKIFDPYFTTKDEGKGTGIGLYMSKLIIEKNMGGIIYARNVNNGVEFIIEMPLEIS